MIAIIFLCNVSAKFHDNDIAELLLFIKKMVENCQ